MATSFQQIEGFLDSRGLKYQGDQEKQIILVPFGFPEIGFDRVTVVIRLQEDGEFFEIIVPGLFHYKEGPHKLPLMQTLLNMSWETKMLQWEYDPSDGEIRATIEFPLEDAVMTERQFFRAFDAMLQFIRVFGPRLREVLETGNDPGRKREGALPEELARSFLEYLRRGGESPGGDGSGGPPDAL
jgi:hypothetical protein